MKVITSYLPSFLHTADAVMNNILEMIFSINFAVIWWKHWLNMTMNM